MVDNGDVSGGGGDDRRQPVIRETALSLTFATVSLALLDRPGLGAGGTGFADALIDRVAVLGSGAAGDPGVCRASGVPGGSSG